MKQILTALLLIGVSYTGAQAQQACGMKNDKVCRRTSSGTSCYKTKYAENFKVCRANAGYFICCEKPNRTNTTRVPFVIKDENTDRQYTYNYQNDNTSIVMKSDDDMTAPQSQSYVVSNSSAYEGYYPAQGHIKVCYGGDNVAELNRAPYEGCPAPAYDGPDANRQRNLNVANPQPMPPLAGQAY